MEARLVEAGVQPLNLGAKRLIDPAAFRRLLALIREEKIDLVHAHLTYASIWASLASRLTGTPALATLHVAPPQGGREGIRDRLMRFALQRWARRVVAVSGALRQQYLAAGGLTPERLVTVHNGIETGRFDRRREECRTRLKAEFGIAEETPLAMTVSVLRPGKGIEVLLRAAARVPGAVFLIVGDGPLRQSWEQSAHELGVDDRVIFAGHRSDVGELLAGGDLLIHPTLADAFPTVLLEAMAAGLPVIASDVGGVPEIVEQGASGLLVPPGDSAALAAAVTALLADAPMRSAMGTRARQLARDRFSTAAWLDRLEALYLEVLGRPQS